ncbi:hypothetical protein V3C99_014334 [Haemonchus contortus]|uniref:Nuclear Hormone Receptor family n=1 Tax=Haemonchus contortus TaxID=6289 RepID=A0A7I5EC34_HAECO
MKKKQCEVCSRSAHGNHFGVNSCRACAAFFRRSVVQGRKYQCRKANGNCLLTDKEKLLCRFCRYQKCISLGMTPENVQLDRDILSTTVERPNSKKNEFLKTGGDEEIMINRVPAVDAMNLFKEEKPSSERAVSEVQPTFDLSDVMSVLRRIFSQPYRPDLEKRLLVQMYFALEEFRSSKNSHVVLLEKIDFLQELPSWKTQLYEIAKWMMKCQDFAELPLEDKETLFKTSWALWQKFERLQMTVQIFGERAIKERMNVTSENGAFNMDTVQLDMGPLSDYTSESIKSMFDHFGCRITDGLRRPLLEMNLDRFELSYILCALVWHVEGKDIRESTRLRAEEVIERISDELHDHYTNDLKMPNYAARLTKIMDIICSIEKAQHHRTKVMELARIFDIFKFDFTGKGFLVC